MADGVGSKVEFQINLMSKIIQVSQAFSNGRFRLTMGKRRPARVSLKAVTKMISKSRPFLVHSQNLRTPGKEMLISILPT